MSIQSGREAQRAGQSFESWLEDQHEEGKRLGLLAHVEHTQGRAKMVGGRLKYVGKGVADYVFCTGLGRYGAAEAKSVKGERLARLAIEPLQARHLDAVVEAGGVSLLLVEFRLDINGYPPVRYAVPWAVVPWQVLRSAESLSVDELSQCRPALEIMSTAKCYLDYFVMPARGSDGQPIDFRPKKVIARGGET